MGMYTELNIAVNFKKLGEPEVYALRRMTEDYETNVPLPDHPLFHAERWDYMLRCSSYYFAGPTHCIFKFDKSLDGWQLSVRSSFKNYDEELEKFLSWIEPLVEQNGFAGYSRYEECDEPTLIYFPPKDGYSDE